jgi:beta-lactam-binding protein with PASTA domain
LNEIKAFKEKVEKIEKENGTKEEFNTWFSKVVTTLEKKVQSEGAPNLQNLDFWSAAQRAREFGLRVVVIGEAAVNSSQPPGQVVQQIPPPGTLIIPGGEIQVRLSKRLRSTTALLEH